MIRIPSGYEIGSARSEELRALPAIEIEATRIFPRRTSIPRTPKKPTPRNTLKPRFTRSGSGSRERSIPSLLCASQPR
jgi:hypothetical protein